MCVCVCACVRVCVCNKRDNKQTLPANLNNWWFYCGRSFLRC